MDNLQEFFLILFQTTGTQIIGVLGIFFAFGYILHIIQHQTQAIYQRTIGWKGILWTAWIGTPIHELGHAFFAILFRHKVTEIALFRPNKETGGLGYVNHSYNKWSLWQRIGNFPVGAAPMIFGTIFLALMFRFLLPGGAEIFVSLKTDLSTFQIILNSLTNTLQTLFTLDNIQSWSFWLFIYISFCIASHIAPSKKDRSQMWAGLFWLILVLLIINALFLWLGVDITKFIFKVNQYLGIFIAMFTYATIISLFHYILVSIVLKPFAK